MVSNMGALFDRLVLIVHPHKLLYIILEGMVPRSKMNQQRP